jgi:hypothetical protein
MNSDVGTVSELARVMHSAISMEIIKKEEYNNT